VAGPSRAVLSGRHPHSARRLANAAPPRPCPALAVAVQAAAQEAVQEEAGQRSLPPVRARAG